MPSKIDMTCIIQLDTPYLEKNIEELTYQFYLIKHKEFTKNSDFKLNPIPKPLFTKDNKLYDSCYKEAKMELRRLKLKNITNEIKKHN